MRITDVQTYVLKVKLEEPFTSARGWWYNTKSTMIAKVLTDEGYVGWGEAYGPSEVAKAFVDNILRELVIGEDPFYTNVLWEKMYTKIKDYSPRGMGIAAISSLDIAFWDIKAKAIRRPLAECIGGMFRNQIEAYATGLYFKKDKDLIELAVEEALQIKESGFKSLKMKIGLGIKEDIYRISKVKEAVGPDFTIYVDSNHAYNVNNAIILGRELERMNIGWFEEPIPPDDHEGYAYLTKNLEIPVAGGENGFTRYRFKEILDKREMNIIQPDICCVGGITEIMKIADMASTAFVQILPHVWGGVIGMAAAIHVIAALEDCPPTWKSIPPILEYEQTPNPFRDDLAENPIKAVNGVVKVPEEPGLGIKINEDILEKYRIK